jgi:hypothetical protein
MTELAVTESTAMVSMIERLAARPDINVDNLERILAMQERIMAKQAEVSFDEAMMACQQEIPAILRNKNNQQTSSRYADLEAINEAIVPIYTKHGFSLSFSTADCPVAEHYRVTCLVSRSGYSRSYQGDIPNDVTGLKGNANKTRTHAFGSTMSYGRRYLTLLIFNITLTNEDNDGQRKQTINPKAGVWDNVSMDDRIALEGIADEVVMRINANNVAGAAKYIAEQGLDNDSKVLLWSLFDSKQRSALKKEMKPAAAESEAPADAE